MDAGCRKCLKNRSLRNIIEKKNPWQNKKFKPKYSKSISIFNVTLRHSVHHSWLPSTSNTFIIYKIQKKHSPHPIWWTFRLPAIFSTPQQVLLTHTIHYSFWILKYLKQSSPQQLLVCVFHFSSLVFHFFSQMFGCTLCFIFYKPNGSGIESFLLVYWFFFSWVNIILLLKKCAVAWL